MVIYQWDLLSCNADFLPLWASQSRPMRICSPATAVGLVAVVSRLLGYVRDVLVAGLLGAGPLAEAFLAALRAPNALRRTLGEGGLNAALTPLYLRIKQQQGELHAHAFARTTLIAAAIALTVLGALLSLGAGILIHISAPGLASRPLEFEIARWWFVLMTPFVGAATLASVAAAFLNAERRYVIAALAPAVVNAALVGAYLGILRFQFSPERSGMLMALSLSIGGLLQLVLAIYPLLPLIRSARRSMTPLPLADLGYAMRLGAPALIATASFQIIGIVASAAASREPSALAWFYYADRLFQLPLSLAGVLIGSVVLSELSISRLKVSQVQQAAGNDTLDKALTLSLAMALPAAAALFILAEPITRTLFERGAFSAEDVAGTSLALAAMAPGLPAGVVARVLLQELLVRERVWISAICGGVGVGFTALVAIVLTPRWGVGGASLAVAAGLWAQCLVMAAIVAGKGWWRPSLGMMGRVTVQALATAAMTGALIFLASGFADGGTGQGARTASLLMVCASGGALYSALVWFGGGLPGLGYQWGRRN